MGLSRARRQGGSPLPDLTNKLARFGQFEYYKQQSNDDPVWIYQNIIAPLYELSRSDPDGVLELLRQNASVIGNWAAYGAGHAVWEIFTSEERQGLKDNPSYLAVMDALLEFLRQNGVPPNRLTGYEWDHWINRGGTASSWIPPRPLPARETAVITPLRDGEVRAIVRITEEPDSNIVLARRGEDDNYEAIVDARQSDEDQRRGQRVWKSAADLYDLYADVAGSLQIPAPWHDSELEPFFPLAKPAI
jgi:hypothetical protein